MDKVDNMQEQLEDFGRKKEFFKRSNARIKREIHDVEHYK